MGAECVSRETSSRLLAFAELLAQWNPTINLVAPSTIEQLWSRHIVDSLRLVPFIADTETCADLGSGAGFPGLVISIARNMPVVLMEADRRKASFLREAIRLTRSEARVYAGRIEEYSGATFQTVTARAFLPLTQIMSLSRHLLTPDGRYLLLKGAGVRSEIECASRVHRFSSIVHTEDPLAGCVLEITSVANRDR